MKLRLKAFRMRSMVTDTVFGLQRQLAIQLWLTLALLHVAHYPVWLACFINMFVLMLHTSIQVCAHSRALNVDQIRRYCQLGQVSQLANQRASQLASQKLCQPASQLATERMRSGQLAMSLTQQTIEQQVERYYQATSEITWMYRVVDEMSCLQQPHSYTQLQDE